MMNKIAFYSLIISLLASCTTPRTMTMTGKVTPRNQFVAGYNNALYIPTATSKYIYRGVKKAVEDFKDKDTVAVNDVLIDGNKMLYAYGLDPLKFSMELYGRWGCYDHFDIGYKFAGGTHVFDARFQFLGSTKSYDNPSDDKYFGSIGIQYSQSKYDLKDKLKINYLQDMLGYSFARKDILVPLVFSIPFGKEEQYGGFAIGGIYGHTFVDYSYLPEQSKIIENQSEIFTGLKGKQQFNTWGTFFNVKGGMEYIFVTFSVAAYYQNYKSYQLINGQQFEIKGWTFVPNLGIAYYFGKGIDF